MSWGMIAGAAIGAIGSAVAADSAADAQSDAVGSANALSQRQFDQIREDQAPYRAVGVPALNQLAMYLGITPDQQIIGDSRQQTRENFDAEAYLRANPDVAAHGRYGSSPYGHWLDFGAREGREFTMTPMPEQPAQPDQSANPLYGSLLRPFTADNLPDDPGYQFRVGEGRRALEGSAAARGGLFSGATLRALERYGQGMASDEFTNAFNRDQINRGNTFNWLSGLSGTGQAATNQVNQQGSQNAFNMGNNLIGAGNARGASYVAQGNALGNFAGQVGSAWNRSRPNNSFYRMDDPYRIPGYFGGDEGE